MIVVLNTETYAKSEHWNRLFTKTLSEDDISDSIVLECPRHPNRKLEISATDGRDQESWTVCKEICTYQYPKCQHKCKMVCHGSPHRDCPFDCERVLETCPYGHKCLAKCRVDP